MQMRSSSVPRLDQVYQAISEKQRHQSPITVVGAMSSLAPGLSHVANAKDISNPTRTLDKLDLLRNAPETDRQAVVMATGAGFTGSDVHSETERSDSVTDVDIKEDLSESSFVGDDEASSHTGPRDLARGRTGSPTASSQPSLLDMLAEAALKTPASNSASLPPSSPSSGASVQSFEDMEEKPMMDHYPIMHARQPPRAPGDQFSVTVPMAWDYITIAGKRLHCPASSFPRENWRADVQNAKTSRITIINGALRQSRESMACTPTSAVSAPRPLGEAEPPSQSPAVIQPDDLTRLKPRPKYALPKVRVLHTMKLQPPYEKHKGSGHFHIPDKEILIQHNRAPLDYATPMVWDYSPRPGTVRRPPFVTPPSHPPASPVISPMSTSTMTGDSIGAAGDKKMIKKLGPGEESMMNRTQAGNKLVKDYRGYSGASASSASSISISGQQQRNIVPNRAFSFEEDSHRDYLSDDGRPEDESPEAPALSNLVSYVSTIYDDELDKMAAERRVERRLYDPYDRLGYFKCMDRKLGGDPADWDESDTDFEDPDETEMQGTAGHVGCHSHDYAEILTRMKEIDVDVENGGRTIPPITAPWRDRARYVGNKLIIKRGTTKGPRKHPLSAKKGKKSCKLMRRMSVSSSSCGGGYPDHDDSLHGFAKKKAFNRDRIAFGGMMKKPGSPLTLSSPSKKLKHSPNKRIKGVKLNDTYDTLPDGKLLCKRCGKATFYAPMALRSHLSHCPGTAKLKRELDLLSRESSSASLTTSLMAPSSAPSFMHALSDLAFRPEDLGDHEHIEHLVEDGNALINREIAYRSREHGWIPVTVERHSARQGTHQVKYPDGTTGYVLLTKKNSNLDREYRGDPNDPLDCMIPPRRMRQESGRSNRGDYSDGTRNDYFSFQEELLSKARRGMKRSRSDDADDSESDHRHDDPYSMTPSPKKAVRQVSGSRQHIVSPPVKAKKGTASSGVNYVTDFQCPKCSQYFINKQALGWHTRKGCNGIKPSLLHLFQGNEQAGGGRIMADGAGELGSPYKTTSSSLSREEEYHHEDEDDLHNRKQHHRK